MKTLTYVYRWILPIGVIALLIAFFSVMYFDDHAWGAWGDDSPGYIFLAARMVQHQPLIYNDPLATHALQFFGDERFARWLIPTHHAFINPDGTIASKYPIGTSMLLAWGARVFGRLDGMYIITPLLAVVNIVFMFMLTMIVFKRYRFRVWCATIAAMALGVSNLYNSHATAQPMREIPSITFLLLTACAIAFVPFVARSWKKVVVLLVIAGVAFGMAVNVRETNILVVPAFLVPLLFFLRQQKSHQQKWQYKKFIVFGIFIFSAFVVYLPSMHNVITISRHKIAFKKNDISNFAILPNDDHIRSLSWDNVFHSRGRFRPDDGSLPHYWSIMTHVVPIPFFIVLVGLGFFALWRDDRRMAWMFGLWILAILGIFSLWINPYSRYILPLFPPLIILGVVGFVWVIHKFAPMVAPMRFFRIIFFTILGTCVIVGYIPTVRTIWTNIHTTQYQYKSISQNDLNTLVTFGESISSSSPPLVIFSGDWQYGLSEIMQAHTNIPTARFPLEQRFPFSEKKVTEFVDILLQEDQEIMVWVDSTSSPQLLSWLTQYETTEEKTFDFTFQKSVRILDIHPKPSP